MFVTGQIPFFGGAYPRPTRLDRILYAIHVYQEHIGEHQKGVRCTEHKKTFPGTDYDEKDF